MGNFTNLRFTDFIKYASHEVVNSNHVMLLLCCFDM